jgi:glycerol-3-phosphate acyltransferase PlsY
MFQYWNMEDLTPALAVLGGYLLGSLPFGYWLPRVVHGEDIRARGSGNVGATNVFRVYGRKLGAAVALLDVTKGFAAALLGIWAGGALVGVLCGAAAMIGHARPIFLRFEKGGKMVATAGGATFALAPLAAFCCIGVWIAVFLLTRYASLASIVTAVALAVFVVLFGYSWPVVAFGVAGAAAVIFLHRRNVRRLAGGTEHRFELSVRKTGNRSRGFRSRENP